MIESLLLLTLAMPPLPFPAFQGGPHFDAHAAALRAPRSQDALVLFDGNRKAAWTRARRDHLTGVSDFGGVVSPHAANYTPQVQDDADDRTSRLDLGLGVISLSAAMIATGLTSSCLAAKTCHERVALTKWAFDRGPVWGVVGRAGVSGLIHYAVARWIPKGKWRTATLATLAVMNVTNAVLDIRTLTKIERDAGR